MRVFGGGAVFGGRGFLELVLHFYFSDLGVRCWFWELAPSGRSLSVGCVCGGAPGASLAGGGTAVEARVKRAPGDRYSHVRVLPLPCVGPLWLLAYILLLPLGLPEVLTLA